MKLILVLNLTLLLQVSATVYSQKTLLNYNVEDLTVKDILKDIESKTGFRFFYNDNYVFLNSKVELNVKNSNVENVLDKLLADTDISYKVLEDNLVVLLPKVEAQQFTVSGKVTDTNGSPLPGVNIVEDGTTNGAITNPDGEYLISVSSPNATLSFSYVGFLTEKIEVGNRTMIDLTLVEDIQALEEVVVVGYGVQKKISLTNSVAQVSGDDITRRPVASLSQSLQGMAPGVTIVDRGGRPGGSDVTIRIRGLTSLGNNSPLVIVDGLEQRLGDINPDDIQNISVLKDASATAIYGSRAANGVILISTKRAEAGDINVSYHGYYGIQRCINRPRHLGLRDYFELENAAYTNAGSAAPYTEEYINEYVNATDREQYPLPYPWFDKGVALKNGPQQNHTLSISGGSERIKSRASIRYQNIDGIISNYSDELAEVRFNSDFQATEKLNFSFDLNYRTSKDLQPIPISWGDAVFFYFLHGSKFAYPKYETGEYGLGPQLNNPLMSAEQSRLVTTRDDYLIGKVKGDYEIITGLKYTFELGIRNSMTRANDFVKKFRNEDPVNGRVYESRTNSLTKEQNGFTEYTLTHLLNFEKTINQNTFNILLGYSTIDNKYNSLTAYRQDFYNNDIQSIESGSDENKDNGGSNTEYGLRSYFGRLNYNFKEKYLIEANARYDGSSRFSKEKQYAFFPSFSAAWRVSQEAFWDRFESFVSELKIRGSYGLTGNQAISLYEFYPALSSVNYALNENPVQGYAQTQFVNNDLTWEKTTQWDLGVDIGLWNYKLNASFDYYNKLTEDILLELPIPYTIGLEPSYQNAGVVKNNGWEASINYKGGNEFTYNIGLNVNYNKNRVKDLLGTGPYIDGSGADPITIIKEGMAINSLWGYRTDGFFKSDEEAAAYPTYQSGTQAGDTKYLDLNNDGQITSDDHAFLGYTFPVHTYGSTMAFGYKNFELFMQWQGAAGHKTQFGGAFGHQATYEAFTHEVHSDYWTPDNTDARWPRPIKWNLRNLQASDIKTVDTDYIRLKNIMLSYRLKGNILDKLPLSNAQIYINATNLLTFSALNEWDMDPEAPSNYLNYYPQVGLYTIGVKLNFK